MSVVRSINYEGERAFRLARFGRIGRVATILRVVIRASTAAVALGSAPLVGADTLASPPLPMQESFREQVLPRAKTGGTYAVALMPGPGSRPPRDKMAFVEVPILMRPYLCVNLVSIDGAYTAHGIFDVTKTPPGVWPISLDVSRSEYREYGAHELVIAVYLAEDCELSKAAGQFFAGWSELAMVADQLNVYVNSDGNDVAILAPLKSKPDELAETLCEPITTDRQMRIYDAICQINDYADLSLEDAWLELRSYGAVVDWEQLIEW